MKCQHWLDIRRIMTCLPKARYPFLLQMLSLPQLGDYDCITEWQWWRRRQPLPCVLEACFLITTKATAACKRCIREATHCSHKTSFQCNSSDSTPSGVEYHSLLPSWWWLLLFNTNDIKFSYVMAGQRNINMISNNLYNTPYSCSRGVNVIYLTKHELPD